MRLVLTMNIEIARKSDLSDFFIYITRQLADNGRADFPLFQPISRQNSTLSVPARQRFMMGVKTPMGQPGWRLLWLAKDKQDRIMGHIDIRPYDDDYCEHRVLLGMGVDSHYRRQGVGRKLIDHVIQYCLYLNKGFNICGEWVDKYRIDGDSISELSMTINTHKGL